MKINKKELTGLSSLSKEKFELAYQKVVLENSFFEKDSYYIQQKPRYFNTLKNIIKLSIYPNAKVLEIGGGQIALLLKEIYGIKCTVADVNTKYGESLLNFGIEFKSCDLLHDDIEEKDKYDSLIMLVQPCWHNLGELFLVLY